MYKQMNIRFMVYAIRHDNSIFEHVA